MRTVPINAIVNEGDGFFLVSFEDGECETLHRSEIMYALNRGYLSEAEATAFKYADCEPDSVFCVS